MGNTIGSLICGAYRHFPLGVRERFLEFLFPFEHGCCFKEGEFIIKEIVEKGDALDVGVW